MEDAEKAEVLDRLRTTRDVLLAAASGLTEAQWRFQPASGGWSIAGCVEHVVLTEELLFRMLSADAPVLAAAPDMAKLEASILMHGPSRTRRIEAPDPVQPKGRYATQEEALQAFRAVRKRTMAYVEGCTVDLRLRPVLNPMFGATTAFVCLLQLTMHSARHTGQIKEIKEDPAFPE